MNKKLTLGPILGLEADNYYTVIFIVSGVKSAIVNFNNKDYNAIKIGEIHDGQVWRAEIHIPLIQISQTIKYTISCDNEFYSSQLGSLEWSFYIPNTVEKPRFAYCSCNGFSDYKLVKNLKAPFHLWEEMKNEHVKHPFSLLLMGGDQIYTDSIWSNIKELEEWKTLSFEKKFHKPATNNIKKKIEIFYSSLYISRWNQPEIAEILASIPSVMMWDDHDIIDGWGSYPHEIQISPVYKAIFNTAKKHFELLQIRGIQNRSLIAKKENPAYYSLKLNFNKYTILALDNRSERTISEIMSSKHWESIITMLNECKTGDLLVMIAIPVVYRDFSKTLTYIDTTPWEEETTDDLKDHWRAKNHQGERQRLIMQLLDNAKKRKEKTIILSGDVHIGCLGVIRDKREATTITIHQIISSGIVHPAPDIIQWLGISTLSNDNTEYLDENKTITTDMLKPYGADQYIRARNFVSLLEGSDNKLWVNWIIDGKDKPEYPLSIQ